MDNNPYWEATTAEEMHTKIQAAALQAKEQINAIRGI
jgi:hypothetical protein